MPEIAPFRGIRYDLDAVGDLATVVAPPYDVISPVERDALEAGSEFNVVRLILGRDAPGDDERSNKYTRARAVLDEWLAEGVLATDDREALYLYEMRTTIGGRAHAMRGLLAAVSLEEPEQGGVLPHERTYDRIVGDRLDLLRATETNLEPVFLVYEGEDGAARDAIARTAAGEPLVRFATGDGVEHALWRIDGDAEIRAIAGGLEKTSIVIADGHHRWRTAQTYAAERRAREGHGPWDRHLAFVVDVGHSGPALLPIHRVVADLTAENALDRLREHFEVEDAPRTDPQALADELADRRARDGRLFVLLDAERAWWLRVADPDVERRAMPSDRTEAWRDLDVAVLHAWVFESLLGGVTPGFVHSAPEAAELVERGEAGIAVLLAPTPFAAVREVAEAGEAMPQKSTYFIPKPKTGLVMRALDRG